MVIKNYADPANIGVVTIPAGDFRNALAGKDITVDIQGTAGNTVSLAYVHHLRQALQSAAGADRNVSIDSTTLMPEFNGKDWWTHGGPVSGRRNLYDGYSKDADTILMNGIKISTDSITNKYMIVYDRGLRVSRPVWHNNNGGVEVPFHGFGLKKGADGRILPLLSGVERAVAGGDRSEYDLPDGYHPTVADWTVYEAALKEAGLHPSQRDSSNNPIRLDHSRVRVNGMRAGHSNVGSNGIYDFVLEYYNPGPTGTPVGGDSQSLLPDWRLSGMTFDGRSTPESVTSRNIGGTVRNSADRKAASGEPREDFIGSITYTMAKYMVDKLGINGYNNTNIIGNYVTGMADQLYNNVAFIGGDYSNISNFNVRMQGVIDFKGPLPRQIFGNLGESRYLNIWSDVSRETNVYRFPVVTIRNSGGSILQLVPPWYLLLPQM